jgi:hypothetical protein
MIETGKIYFLSRPRRFGKSLIVSTLESLFKGDKELFKELYLYDDWNWDETYLVILLDLSTIGHSTSEEYSIELKQISYSSKFSELIKKISKSLNKKVVVLIDEYDKSIIDNTHDIKIADDKRQLLHDFYQILKSNDKYLKFIFLNGVNKFSGTSIFSGLNNPDNITLGEDYGTICGFTLCLIMKLKNF